MYVSVGSLWKKINNGYVSVGGLWKKINTGYVAVGGLWKKFFTTEVLAPQYPVIISQATNGTTYLTTLTGTNYYWSPGPPVLTYRFQWWNGVSWSDISTANAINPAYGSSTSYTQLLQSTGPSVYVQPNQVNRFRFKVDATYGSESASSISSETTIQGPTSVTLTAGTAATTSVDLSWTASTGANRYMVYYSTNNSVFSLFAGTSLTSTTVTGLTSSTLYYFKVIPITGSSNDTGYYGSYSNTVSQSTLTPQYTVTWNAGGGTGGGSTGPFNAGTAHTAPSPGTRDGYTFNGYYNTPTLDYLYGPISSGGSFTPTSSITMHARWTANTYTISYNGNNSTGGSTASGSYTTGGTAYTISANGFTRTGYTFSSWNTAANGSGTSYSVGASYSSTANLILYAQWTIITYTITYLRNDGSGTAQGTSTFTSGGSTVSASTPTRGGYTFNGWFDTGSLDYTYTVAASTSWFPPDGNRNMYARWTLTPIIPTITMGANSGITQTSGTINWTSTNQANFSSNGSISGSGTTATSITNNSLSAGTTYTGTVTVTSSTGNTATANYSLTTSVAQYTVTWNANGGTGGGSTGPFNAGVAHTAPSAARSGYTLNGYHDTPSGDYTYGPIAAGGSFTPPSTMTMYARWTAATSAPGTPVVAGDNSLSVGGTFTWSCTGSPAPVYRVTIGYNASNSAGPFQTRYQQPATGPTVANGLSITSIRPGYDLSPGLGWAGSGYYRCTIQAINSAGGPTTGSATVFMT